MSKIEVTMVCEECGKDGEIDKKQSNKNWNVYKTECTGCGGKIVPKVTESKKIKKVSGGETDMAQCKAKCKGTQEQCRRRAVEGYNVCTVHGAGTRKRVEQGLRKPPGAPITTGGNSKHMKKEIYDKIEEYKKDPDLEKLDFELAYLKTLPQRIENSGAEETDKIVLLEKVLTSTFKNMSEREKVIEARRYSIGVEKLQLLIKCMFTSVKKHVSDPNVLIAIAQDLRNIAGNTDNMGKDGANIPMIGVERE